MRNYSNLIKLTCPECNQSFSAEEESKKHFHAVTRMSETPLSYLLVISPGIRLGSADGVRSMAEAFKELKEKHPEKKFRFFEYTYAGGADSSGSYQYLESLMAIEE